MSTSRTGFDTSVFDARYRVEGADRLLTPALAVYPDEVEANLEVTLRLLGGRVERWRPHVKTAKLACVVRRLVERGVGRLKCANSLELRVACDTGATDVLVAYPVVGAHAERVRSVAERFPGVGVSALVDAPEQLEAWAAGPVGLFVDVDPGMHRTGIDQQRAEAIVAVARGIVDRGIAFRGLHYYDGHRREPDLEARTAAAHRGYDRLLELVGAVEDAGIAVEEVVTAGTPSLPCSLSYRGFDGATFVHRVSAGTVVYNNLTSLGQLPGLGYRPAAMVLSTVVSRGEGRVTCDAGHKTVSADEGVPTCAVLGRPGLQPGRPSEEHLPLRVADGSDPPEVGEVLHLLPRHVCPTVNAFDHAVIVREGRVHGIERVTARGREAPLAQR